MKSIAHLKALPPLAAVMLLAVAGCSRESVQVYNVDTNDTVAVSPPAPAPAAMPGGMPATMPTGLPTPDNSGLPTLKFTAPAGWQQKPASQMRVASFGVTEGGKQVDISVVPLGGMGGGDLANVNRWRGQVSQPPLTEADLQKLAEALTIAGQPASVYDVAGAQSDEAPTQRILGAIQHRDDTVWFFKMTGDGDLVEKQKPAFIDFLKSVQFADASAAAAPMDLSQLPPSHPAIGGMTPPAGMAAPDAGSVPVWTVPAGWQSGPLSQFLVAKFIIAGGAEVNVSSLAGEGGGLLPNINRWRQQLALAPVTDPSEAKPESIDTAGGKATVVDFSGTNARTGTSARLVGVILFSNGQTWFYKLMGDPGVVAAQKDALVKLVQSAKYPAAS